MQRKRMMLTGWLLGALLCSAASLAGTLDPLLRAWDPAKAEGPGLRLDRVLAVDARIDPDDPLVGVILHLDGAFDPASVPGLVTGSRRGGLLTARLPFSSLPYLEAVENVRHVQAARLLRPTLDEAVPAGQVDHVWAGSPAYTGEGVLVGVIDSGIDWRHEDFDAAGGDTRILYLFDQYVNGTHPSGFAYGAEYDATAIDAGLLNEQDLAGHGTHVAGIAAGDGSTGGGTYKGVAHEADLIIVKSYDDTQGGFPEDKVIDALNYLADKAETLGRPLVVNMSLGGHMGPHDGTTAQEQVIDDISGAGRVVCVAAGNEGESYIHHSGPASDTTFDLTVDYLGNSPNPGIGNDHVYLNLWYEGASSPTVTVSYAGGSLGPVPSGSSASSGTANGYIVVDNASGGVDATNGDKQVFIQLDDQAGTAPQAGTWSVRVQGGSGTVHVWMVHATMGAGFAASDQGYSVGMPGTSEQAVSVAAWKSRNIWPTSGGNAYYVPGTSFGDTEIGDRAPFSSVGPTRDGREKPDLSAPGMGIMAPYASTTSPVPQSLLLSPDGQYILSQGTSMASPFVAGVAALMLEKDATLTAAEIRNILRSTADTDSYTGAGWNALFGAGKVDALGAIAAVTAPGPDPTGDVNADGGISVLDLVVLANHIVDPSGHPLDATARMEADVYPAPSGDGVLNASDLARIVAIILNTEGKTAFASDPGAPPVQFRLDPLREREGRWWQPVVIAGPNVAAGQFVLELDDGVWEMEAFDPPAGIGVATRIVGTGLRLLFYGLSPDLAADELRLEIPLPSGDEAPFTVRAAGILLAAPGGEPRTVEQASAPSPFWLRAAPNPSDAEMTISFARAAGRDVDLSVYDVRGRRVRSLQDAGGPDGLDTGQVVFDGRGDDGQRLAAGMYFLVYRSGGQMAARKIVLTR